MGTQIAFHGFEQYDLALLQRSMNRCYNVRMKFLNKNAFDKVLVLLKEESFCDEAIKVFDNELETFFKRYSDIENCENCLLLEPNTPVHTFIKNRLDAGLSKIDKWICPLIDKPSGERRNDNENINLIIYTVFPDSADPVFYELRELSPFVRLYVRYYYLALLRHLAKEDEILNSDTTDSKLLISNNPLGYYELILLNNHYVFGSPVPFTFYPVISNICLIEKIKNEFEFESKVKEIIDKIGAATNEKSKAETIPLQHLISQLSAYSLLSIFDLRTIAVNIDRIIRVISALSENNDFVSLDTFHKMKAFDTIPFLVSSKAKKIIQGYLFGYLTENLKQELKEKNSNSGYKTFARYASYLIYITNELKIRIKEIEDKKIAGLKFRIRLSDKSKDSYNLSLEAKNNYNLFTLKDLIIEDDFRITIEKKQQEKKIAISATEPNLNNFLVKIEEKIHYYLNKTYRDNIIKTHAFDRIFLNSLRYELEKIESEGLQAQYDLVAKYALHKVMADEVYIFVYNNNSDPIKFKLKSFYSNKQNLIEEKQPEVSISDAFHRFDIQMDASNFIISRFDQYYEDIEKILRKDFINEKYNDLLSLPLICNNRKLGVILLLSYKKYHFNVTDRILMTDFVHFVGIELLKSKLIYAIQDISKSENYRIISKIIQYLLNANEVLIFLDVSEYEKRVLIYSGNTFRYKTGEKVSNSELLKLFKFDNVEISSFNEYKGISIPIKTIEGNGYIVIIDDEGIRLSESLKRECLLLGNEVAHVIGQIVGRNRYLEEMKSLIAHDISSQLRSIEGAKMNADRYIQKLLQTMKTKDENPEKNVWNIDVITDITNIKRKLELSLKDIETFTITSKQLIDYFTTISDKDKIDDNVWKSSGIKYFIDHHNKHMRGNDRSDIHSILRDCLEANKKALQEKRIIYDDLLGAGSWPPLLWIHKALTRQVFNNMIINVAKYALENSRFKISIKRSITGWSLFLENISYSVVEDEEKRIDEIFKRDIRFNNSKGEEGAGLGLYFSY